MGRSLNLLEEAAATAKRPTQRPLPNAHRGCGHHTEGKASRLHHEGLTSAFAGYLGQGRVGSMLSDGWSVCRKALMRMCRLLEVAIGVQLAKLERCDSAVLCDPACRFRYSLPPIPLRRLPVHCTSRRPLHGCTVWCCCGLRPLSPKHFELHPPLAALVTSTPALSQKRAPPSDFATIRGSKARCPLSRPEFLSTAVEQCNASGHSRRVLQAKPRVQTPLEPCLAQFRAIGRLRFCVLRRPLPAKAASRLLLRRDL